MEEKGGVNSSEVTVKGGEAPESYRVAPRSESNNIEFSGSIVATTPVSVTEETKKKRGRPRKYGPDGKVAIALSPMPISASIPLAGDFSAFKKTNKFEVETPGNIFPSHRSFFRHLHECVCFIILEFELNLLLNSFL